MLFFIVVQNLGASAADEDVVLLGIAEDEDVIFPPVVFTPAEVVLFPAGTGCF
jgi:hypothetical protein